MIRFTVPDGVVPGQTVNVPTASGGMIPVQIPEGVKPGQELEVQDTTAAPSVDVVIPEGSKEGDKLNVQTESGMIEIIVPPGSAPGSTVRIQLPASAPPQPSMMGSSQSTIFDGPQQGTSSYLPSNNNKSNPPNTLDIEMGSMNANSTTQNPFQHKKPSNGRKSYINTKFVIPEGVVAGSIISTTNPVTGLQHLYVVPPGSAPGDTVELSFEKEEPVEIEMITVQVQVPQGLEPDDPVDVKLPDGRTITINFPREAEAGQMFDVQVPKDINIETAELNVMGDDHLAKFKPEDYPQNNDADIVRASLNSGLKFDELVLVVWRKNDTIFRCDMAVIGPAIYKFIDQDGDGDLTVEELVAAMTNPDILAYVDSIKCPVLGRLFHSEPKAQIKAFKKIDEDGSGSISLPEWKKFLSDVQRNRLKYYRKQFLLKDHVYMGRGMEPGESYSEGGWLDAMGCYRGYFDDFKYYAKNNHPLLMIFYSDPVHPYSRNQRTAEFIGCMCTGFFGAGLQLASCSVAGKLGISLLTITLPTIIFRAIVYTLFTASCLIHDESKTSESVGGCMDCCTGCASGVAYFFTVIWSLFFFVFGLVYWIIYVGTCDNSTPGGEFAYFIYSIGQYWVLWFVIELSFDFNPFPSARNVLGFINCLLRCACVETRVGRWYIEREKILGVIDDKIKERGADKFFLPDQLKTMDRNTANSGLA
mmetsp:Transcript_3068/g.4206  ORF Transcript_3068/g.4206 Transcript_3068/m.4206 type:complete len:700 (+) Transcript_3068:31-2130(+)